MPLGPADREALSRVLSIQPAWTGIVQAAEVTNIRDKMLLHSGPPFKTTPVTPILNSAAVACVFEGWAQSLAEADELLASGEVAFAAAQGFNVATPLAAVVSPSMNLNEMTDLKNPMRNAFAPLNGGGDPEIHVARFGFKSEYVLNHIRFLNEKVATALRPLVNEPIPWPPIFDYALCNGDDIHLQHDGAYELFLRILTERDKDLITNSEVGEFLRHKSIFHLDLAMAAILCALLGSKEISGNSLISAIGGNGLQFGIQVGGLPEIGLSLMRNRRSVEFTNLIRVNLALALLGTARFWKDLAMET